MGYYNGENEQATVIAKKVRKSENISRKLNMGYFVIKLLSSHSCTATQTLPH